MVHIPRTQYQGLVGRLANEEDYQVAARICSPQCPIHIFAPIVAPAHSSDLRPVHEHLLHLPRNHSMLDLKLLDDFLQPDEAHDLHRSFPNIQIPLLYHRHHSTISANSHGGSCPPKPTPFRDKDTSYTPAHVAQTDGQHSMKSNDPAICTGHRFVPLRGLLLCQCRGSGAARYEPSLAPACCHLIMKND